MKKILQIILIILAIYFAFLAYRSIMRPEKFKIIYELRKNEIRNRLTALRTVQVIYKNEKKKYASNVDELVDFVNNGYVTIVKNIGNIPESMTEEEAFKKGLITKQTVKISAKEKILETDPGISNLNDFQFIPFNYGEKFVIQIDSIVTRTYTVPVYRIDVSLDQILSNMNESINNKDDGAIKKLYNNLLYKGLSNEKQYRNQYLPIWMGSLTEANTAGSWE